MNSSKGVLLVAFLALGFLLLSFSAFRVGQIEHAIEFKFGRIVKSDFEPGLHFKYPWHTVLKFSKQILTLDSAPEPFLTSEQKYVDVDFFAQWKIIDVGTYYQAVRGLEATAQDRLLEILKNGLKNEVANRSLKQVISAERAEVMDVITVAANDAASSLGIEIIDVRIKRIEMPDNVTESIYQRMRTDRQQFASQTRAEGAEQAEQVRADAERQRTVLLAEAFRDAEQIRGEGDARAAEIYAAAYNRDPEFFSFYRSLTAYRNAMSEGKDVLVIDPESDFFKYFNNSRTNR
ncbi:MAG: protease modulator HflC [Gammaproteobacteria bacterium]|nr:protease modulator HflC [Gammaproteobacteria bacterium]